MPRASHWAGVKVRIVTAWTAPEAITSFSVAYTSCWRFTAVGREDLADGEDLEATAAAGDVHAAIVETGLDERLDLIGVHEWDSSGCPGPEGKARGSDSTRAALRRSGRRP